MCWTTFKTASGSFLVRQLDAESQEVRFPQCGPQELLDAEVEILSLLTALHGRQLHLHAGSMMCSMPASAHLAQRLAARLQTEGRTVVSSGFWYQRTSIRESLPEMAASTQSATVEREHQSLSGVVISQPA